MPPTNETPTKEQLLDDDEIETYDHSPSRWGNYETRVYLVGDAHWALDVSVSAGDEGGTEAFEDPYRVKSVEVTTTKWERVK